MNKKSVGLIIGILVAIVINSLPLHGLTPQGKMCLGLTLMTVIFWACQIAQAGYISGLFLVLLIIFQVAPVDKIFYSWTGPIMYLVIGAYLIASAVKNSGLGERIAYSFILKYVSSFKSIIISIFVLTFILSLLIPHPWPRAFIIMSVMAAIIKSTNMPKEDAVKVGFTVFAASVPVSLIFLTGDSVINPLAVEASHKVVSWLGWLLYMGIPSLISSVLTCILILVLFKPTKEIAVNKEEIKNKITSLGNFSSKEIRTVIWLCIAVLLWMTDSIHGINIGWVTLMVAVLMSMPLVGEVLTPKSWGEVPMQVLLFLTAAMAIGKVGGITGMNTWIANTILPAAIPHNIFVLAAFIGAASIVIHMLLGSVIAVMGVAIPTLLIFTEPLGINPLVTTLFVYTAIAIHYILPFQHLNMLVGSGEENGMYTQEETIRLGVPLTAVVFIVMLVVEIPWWKIVGIL